MPDFFSDKVIAFNKALKLDIALPQGFSTLNPYLENPETLVVMVAFYKKYYLCILNSIIYEVNKLGIYWLW